MVTVTLTINNETDNLLQLKARDILNGSNLSSAAVDYELRDSASALVDSGSMAHAGSGSPDADGRYIFNAIIQDTIALVAGGSYTTIVVFNAGSNAKKTIKVPTVANYATS